ncbi:hypothetical protein B0H14DRAFT_2613576 [Mycena olivaceomarginata]|nr:hypothetical protein B0H14DRAFT_2613576 [Mycena olivaceomarginata]
MSSLQHAEGFPLDLGTMDADCEPDDDDDRVELNTIDISKTEKTALLRLVTQTFRRVCNIPGGNWPDPNFVRTNPITDEVYPSPIFSAKVTDHRNSSIVQDVAQRDPYSAPPA